MSWLHPFLKALLDEIEERQEGGGGGERGVLWVESSETDMKENLRERWSFGDSNILPITLRPPSR